MNLHCRDTSVEVSIKIFVVLRCLVLSLSHVESSFEADTRRYFELNIHRGYVIKTILLDAVDASVQKQSIL